MMEKCIVQGVECVLKKGVHIVLYKVYSVYFTGCSVRIFTSKSSVNKEDFDIKADLI